jgi:hypothetical protein
MMAIGIITKEKHGMVKLNTEGEELNCMENDLLKRKLEANKELMAKRKQRLIELLTQYLAIKKLMKRNLQVNESEIKIGLPFILVELSKLCLLIV